MSTTLVDLPDQTAPLLAGPAPLAGWVGETRQEAWQQFLSLPMPVRTDERWRFSGINRLTLDRYQTAGQPTHAMREEAAAGSTASGDSLGRMMVVNDRLVEKASLPTALAEQGVLWLPLSEAVTHHAGMFREHFMSHFTGLGAEKFAHLHRAFVQEGMLIYVPNGVEIDKPLENFYWLAEENASVFPHTLVITGTNARVTVVDYFQGLPGVRAGLACGVNDLFVGEGSHVTYIAAQAWPREARSFHFNSTHVGRDATVHLLTAHLGGGYNRSESVSHLTAPGASSNMLAVTLATEDQEFDQRTLQDHQTPNTSSDLLYKNALDDSARTIFSGLIKVEPGAHRTDAYQKVRNLMLSDDAEANSMPGLEILADDVRCTHGATGGQIDREELFYLMSRGLSERASKQLIVGGFLKEVFDRVNAPAVTARLASLIEGKLLRRPATL
ncbi:MAG: Fe-S cluster assembly protein SufD [Verrucomicrobiia bacterium]